MTNYFEITIPGTDVTGNVKYDVKYDVNQNGAKGFILNCDTSDLRDKIETCLQRLKRLRNSAE
ncbi:MAG: hypothetical protein AB7E51_02390 [Pseudodesulfovibrio sp.]|uniref:hypothetical protein n=1 Tax=Pseudodesulfovibrio sp. TaxID=2035812 RepID=UPI003D12D8F6